MRYFYVQMLSNKKKFGRALAGTVLVALCCFTPLLVVTLGAVGLSVIVSYLDFILFPALALLLLLTHLSFSKWMKEKA